MRTTKRLTRDDWLAAGFLALAEGGPAQLKAESLARRLKTTKGSFYWHFADLPAYKAAMLELWREKVATEIMADILKISDPEARLRAMALAAARPAPEIFGGRKIEPAFRAWSLGDDDVATALKKVDQIRLAFVGQLLTDVGIADPAITQLVYGAYIGLDDLASKHDPEMLTALETLVEVLLSRKDP